ncbi:MAG: aldo/keto reductase, partial [Actinomycetota bacterium]
MPTRSLAGQPVGAIGLGCMTMSWGYLGEGTDEEAVSVIRRAFDLGVTHFDTADVYGPYRNEDLVGEALRGNADAFVATKVGLVVGPNGGYPLRKDARPERIRDEVVGSLRRLGRDVLDLYYLHRPDPVVPFEESYGALADLVR